MIDFNSHQSDEERYLGIENDSPVVTGPVAQNPLSAPLRNALLIIEDFDAIRAAIANHYASRRYAIYSASTIADACVFAKRESPIMVVIDWELTGQAALAAATTLRTALPSAVIVMIGCPETPEITMAAKAAGASQVLPRKFRISDLDPLTPNSVHD